MGIIRNKVLMCSYSILCSAAACHMNGGPSCIKNNIEKACTYLFEQLFELFGTNGNGCP